MEVNLLNVTERGGLTIVEIDRPPLNILSMSVLDDLRVAFARIAASETRAVLIRGAGKCFSAGADVAEHLPGSI